MGGSARADTFEGRNPPGQRAAIEFLGPGILTTVLRHDIESR